MLDDLSKNKSQLITELNELRERIAHLETNQCRNESNSPIPCNSKVFYRTILDHIIIPALIIENDFTISMANSKFESLVGYNRSEIESKKRWTDFVYEEDHEIINTFQAVVRIDQQPVPKNFDLRLLSKAGTIKSVIMTIETMPASEKSIASFLDITVSRHVFKALRKSKEKYKLLVDTMNDGLITQNKEGFITYANRQACDILGRSRTDLIGKTIHQFIDTQSISAWNNHRSHSKKKKPPSFEIKWKGSKKLKSRYTMVTIHNWYNEHKHLAGSFAIISDVTMSKKTEEAMRLAEEMFAKAFTSSPSSIFIATLKDQKILNVNDSFIQATGYYFNDVVGRTLPELNLFHSHGKGARSIITLKQKGQLRNKEIEFCTKLGEIRLGVMSAEIFELWDEPCMLVSFEDVTETKRLERKIQEISENERRKIGRDLHDDLCPHLIGIEALSKVFRERCKQKLQEDVKHIDKIRMLIKEGIEKSRRLSRGLCPVEMVEHGLEDSLRELSNNTREMFGIPCFFRCDQPVQLRDNTVATHLYYIAREALHNAVKHATPKSIWLELSNSNHQILLKIKDDGCGISQQHTLGMGFHTMNYRAKIIGATFDIHSDASSGTMIALTMNYDQDMVN